MLLIAAKLCCRSKVRKRRLRQQDRQRLQLHERSDTESIVCRGQSLRLATGNYNKNPTKVRETQARAALSVAPESRGKYAPLPTEELRRPMRTRLDRFALVLHVSIC